MLSANAVANTVYVTDFTKDNNIYTNLNVQYPHTGVGTPGSGVGAANATFLFNPDPTAVATGGYAPNYVAGSNLVNNGVDFDLTSDASGHDFEQIPNTTLTTAVSLQHVTNVYLLMGAYFGTDVNVTFTAADGDTQTFTNLSVPDFNGGVGSGGINDSGPGFFDATVFNTLDVGAGGSGNSSNGAYNYYDLTELGFTLTPAVGGDLSSISISAGNTGLLLGITTVNSLRSSAPDVASTLALCLAAGLALVGFRKLSEQAVAE
ncbi:MAG TPA: hypothetical protein VGL42_06040 [Opitutaceae bacterium]|jgi:hypothetical protein